MKNQNLSLLDANQMSSLMFDEKHDAQRVVIVGDNMAESIANAVTEGIKNIKIDVAPPAPFVQPIVTPQLDPLVIKIPYQTVIKETEVVTINVPTIVTEYKIIEVEKPIMITNTEVVTVEKQIVVTQYKDIPQVLYWLFGAQLLINLLTAILHK